MKQIPPKIWNAIIDISPVQFSVYDLVKHHRIFSSGLAEKILGYSYQELQQFSTNYYKDIIVEEDYPIIENNFNRLLNSVDDSMVEGIFRMKTKLGGIVWVRTHQRVLERDKNGKPSKIIASSEDITELKELEQRLEEEVGKLNAIPTKNLQELRIQLNAVTNIMDQFRENHFSSEMDRRLWGYMFSSVQKMNRVVDDLL